MTAGGIDALAHVKVSRRGFYLDERLVGKSTPVGYARRPLSRQRLRRGGYLTSLGGMTDAWQLDHPDDFVPKAALDATEPALSASAQ
jgi:hypothetical protein